MSKHLELPVSLLEDYQGREKIMRTLCYASLLLSGIAKNSSNSRKLQTISAQLSLCRTILRLFDDIPMLAYTLSYGFGSREGNTLVRILGVLKNAVDQTFFPLEHIAWAADNKLVNIQSTRWWYLSVSAWMVSLSLGLMKDITNMLRLETRRKNALRLAKKETISRQQSLLEGQLHEAALLSHQQSALSLSMLADMCDLCNAVNWMPPGFLWSTKLSNGWIGFFGTVSSLIKMGLLIQHHR